jgi:hypothetical protein
VYAHLLSLSALVEFFIILLTVVTCETVRFWNRLLHRVLLFHGLELQRFTQPLTYFAVLCCLCGSSVWTEFVVSNAVAIILLVISETEIVISNALALFLHFKMKF